MSLGTVIKCKTEVETNLRIFSYRKDDSKDLVMGVQWCNYIFSEPHDIPGEDLL